MTTLSKELILFECYIKYHSEINSPKRGCDGSCGCRLVKYALALWLQALLLGSLQVTICQQSGALQQYIFNTVLMLEFLKSQLVCRS